MKSEGVISGIETSKQIRKDMAAAKKVDAGAPKLPDVKRVTEGCGCDHSEDKEESKEEKAKAKIVKRGGPPGYPDKSRTARSKPMGEAYSDVYERMNPFQVTFDKDGNEEDRKKRDSTPEAKAADAKRDKNRADNMKKGPMAYKPYGNNE